jgi:hypothetical protein
MFDIVNCLCLVVNDYIIYGSFCIELRTHLVDYIYILSALLGVKSYSLLNLPLSIISVFIS